MHPVSERDHVGRAGVLDLDQGALARRIRLIERLGDHSVEARAFELGEPAHGRVAIARGARDVQGMLDLGHQLLQTLAPLGEGDAQQVFIIDRQQVERDEHRGCLCSQLGDPRGRGVDALAQCFPVEPLRARSPRGDDDLAVEQARAR